MRKTPIGPVSGPLVLRFADILHGGGGKCFSSGIMAIPESYPETEKGHPRVYA
ncbi:hypothetical protein [Photobacterium sp. R1]